MKIISTLHTRITTARIALDSVQAAIGAKWLWLAVFALSFLACEIVASMRYVYTFLFYQNKQALLEKSLGHALDGSLVVIDFFSEYAVPAVGWSAGLTLAAFIVISFSRENARTGKVHGQT
jgi:hypothetical protein